ncbi:hypothetical protein EVAR_101738_1 [Eumeta japonica]|uniref:Uncharacterized protein n=1 Tax=Eumeta variegata TaxID=151549 RepID=A0A4C1SMX1_EUMVA|nr:hypothetical protein EVAR_101738_1 [Eumeta japonica]
MSIFRERTVRCTWFYKTVIQRLQRVENSAVFDVFVTEMMRPAPRLIGKGRQFPDGSTLKNQNPRPYLENGRKRRQCYFQPVRDNPDLSIWKRAVV